MKPHVLEVTTIINKPLNEVFEFFSKAENLDQLTPTELKFKILTPLPIVMKKGALIDYRIQLNGIPFNWRTEITEWEPGVKFADKQIKGPYALWHHTHTFKAIGDSTEMTDRIEYLAPGWIFEPIIHQLIVKSKVEAIFKYREQKLSALFQ